MILPAVSTLCRTLIEWEGKWLLAGTLTCISHLWQNRSPSGRVLRFCTAFPTKKKLTFQMQVCSYICPKYLSATCHYCHASTDDISSTQIAYLFVSTEKEVPCTWYKALLFLVLAPSEFQKKSSQVLLILKGDIDTLQALSGSDSQHNVIVSLLCYCVINRSFSRTKQSIAIPCMRFLNSSAFVALSFYLFQSVDVLHCLPLCWSVLHIPPLFLVCV